MRHPELAILSHHTTIFTTDSRFAVHLFPRSGVVELRIHKVVCSPFFLFSCQCCLSCYCSLQKASMHCCFNINFCSLQKASLLFFLTLIFLPARLALPYFPAHLSLFQKLRMPVSFCNSSTAEEPCGLKRHLV